MKSIEDEIVSYIKSVDDFTFKDIQVIEPYSYKEPDFNKVVIIVQELINSPYEDTFTNKEEHSNLTYQVSILSRVQKLEESIENENGEIEVKSTNVSPYKVTRTVYYELVDKLYDKFLLERVGDPITRAYSLDDTVLERVFRVANVIDLEHEYLYRR